jgi:hypothetical protein
MLSAPVPPGRFEVAVYRYAAITVEPIGTLADIVPLPPDVARPSLE